MMFINACRGVHNHTARVVGLIRCSESAARASFALSAPFAASLSPPPLQRAVATDYHRRLPATDIAEQVRLSLLKPISRRLQYRASA